MTDKNRCFIFIGENISIGDRPRTLNYRVVEEPRRPRCLKSCKRGVQNRCLFATKGSVKWSATVEKHRVSKRRMKKEIADARNGSGWRSKITIYEKKRRNRDDARIRGDK